ncbi:hypothetical protein JCM3774_005550 [Rhodotorula dairenensis]
MDRAGASSDSRDADCPPPPPRPTSLSAARQPPAAAGAVAGSTPAPGVVSPSTQARQAFKFAVPAVAGRNAAPPAVATKSPTRLPSSTAAAARPESGSAFPPPRLRHFQATPAHSVGRAALHVWAPPSSTDVTGFLPSKPVEEEDPTDEADQVLLVGHGLEFVTDLDAAGRYITGAPSADEASKLPGADGKSTSATAPLESAPTDHPDLGLRHSTVHRRFDEASRLGPKSFRPARPSHLRPEARSPVPGTPPSEDPTSAVQETLKHTSSRHTAEEPAKKRQRDAMRLAADEAVKQSSREATPRTDPAASDLEANKAGKKPTSSRPTVLERPKRSSGSRAEPRSRPATSSAFYDETVANLRRWQRHEAETDEEIRRLKTQLELKDQELAGARLKLDKLKTDLSHRVAVAGANASNAESDYRSALAQIRATLDGYQDQLSSELVELRAQIFQTKTRRSTVESLKGELGTAVGDLTETRGRLDTEAERASAAQTRAEAYADRLDELRRTTTEEIARLAGLRRELLAEDAERRLQHEEHLQAKDAAQDQLRRDFQKTLDDREQKSRQAVTELERAVGDLRREIAKLVEQAALAAQDHVKALSQLQAQVVEKENGLDAAETKVRRLEMHCGELEAENARLSDRLEQVCEELRIRDQDHLEKVTRMKADFDKLRDELAGNLEEAKVKTNKLGDEVSQVRTTLERVQIERDGLLVSERAARQAADEAHTRLEAWEAEARMQSEAFERTEQVARDVEKRLKTQEAKVESTLSEKEHVQRQLDTAESMIVSLQQALEKRQAREDSGTSLRRQIDELTAAAADAMAEQTRARDAQKALEEELEGALRTNKTLAAEQAELYAEIDNLEAQSKELRAQVQHAAESAVTRAPPSEANLQAMASAFEKEKQEAVRKAIESCSERSKVENLKLQNELKRANNRLAESEQKLNKAQTDLIQAKAAQLVKTNTDPKQAHRAPLFTGGTPVGNVSSSTIGSREAEGEDSPIRAPITASVVDESSSLSDVLETEQDHMGSTSKGAPTKRPRKTVHCGSSPVAAVCGVGVLADSPGAVELSPAKAPKRRRSSGSASGSESHKAAPLTRRRTAEPESPQVDSIGSASDSESEHEQPAHSRTLSKLATQDDDDDGEDFLEEEPVVRGDSNEDEDDPIENSMTPAPQPLHHATGKPPGRPTRTSTTYGRRGR